MSDYQVVDREQLDADMTDVADHIRAKAEISTPLAWPDGYKAAVDAIQTGVELPELTNPGAASDLLAGKELIGADGEVVVGTAPERGSGDLIVSNNGIVVPAGHYPKQANAVLDSVELATPSIEVSDNGLITARVVQPSGYVSYGAKKQTKQLPTQGATTITPTETPQKAVEAGTYVTGDIVVDAAEGGVLDGILEVVETFTPAEDVYAHDFSFPKLGAYVIVSDPPSSPELAVELNKALLEVAYLRKAEANVINTELSGRSNAWTPSGAPDYWSPIATHVEGDVFNIDPLYNRYPGFRAGFTYYLLRCNW